MFYCDRFLCNKPDAQPRLVTRESRDRRKIANYVVRLCEEHQKELTEMDAR